MQGTNNRQQKGQQEQQTNNYECLNPLTKSVIMFYQGVQTFGLLVLVSVYYWGKDSWIGVVMPAPGTFAIVVILLAMFVFLWIKRIRVFNNAK